MSNSRLIKRLKAEVEDLEENPVPNCSAGPFEDDITHWIATIIGPVNTPYENGVFKLDISFLPDHPFKAPKVCFNTPIYHCNINKHGAICLDILKDQWSPALTISRVLLSICSLLSEPNPDDPLEPDIAKLLIKNKKEHDSLAREWTIQYASPG